MTAKIRYRVWTPRGWEPVQVGVQIIEENWGRTAHLAVIVPLPAPVRVLCRARDIRAERISEEELELFRQSVDIGARLPDLQAWLERVAPRELLWQDGVFILDLDDESIPDFLREAAERLMASTVLQAWLDELARKHNLQISMLVVLK